MAHKQILFGSSAREKILRGASVLADAVRVTLGPKSKCVLIQKKWGTPLVCNDGVAIAKEVDLKDPDENLGVQMLRQAAERTGEAIGDSTTTSTLLAHAIFSDEGCLAQAKCVLLTRTRLVIDLAQAVERSTSIARDARKQPTACSRTTSRTEARCGFLAMQHRL
jgi:chaperonin GroEL (HSP60 family)